VKRRIVPASKMFSTDLGGTSLPARGLLYSILAHALCAVISLYVPWSYWFPAEVHFANAQSMIQEREVLYLPDLQPMGSDSPPAPPDSRREETKKDEAPPSSSSPKAVQGVVYTGPQLIISNPPHPDNFVQTIRQPDLALRPKLPAPLQMPPMVSIAPAKPILAPPAPHPAPEAPPQKQPVRLAAAEPILLPSQQPKVEAPKLPLPAASSTEALRTVANAAAPATMPTLAHQKPATKSGTAAHNILVVSAVPVPNVKPPVLPPGELLGAFTVLPRPVEVRPGAASMGLAGGGSEAKGAPGLGGNASGAGVGATTSPNPGTGNRSTGGTGGGNGIRAGAGSGTGTNHGSPGGKDMGSGSGAAGHASGNGGGPGTGSGNSPFPSIMIQGGSGGSERSGVRAPAGDSTPQNSYGITIVASGASGGGFKDYGIFRDEASYTVYLDMTDAGAYGSSWTLQYALDSSNRGSYSHGLLVPPYATSKLLPHISSDTARKDRGATIVVFGVISSRGRFEDLRIMQGPDPGLDQLLLDSLRKWVFRPAEVDGAQVRVKVLLGVPVNSLPLQEFPSVTSK
jgi:hypothetical protein